MALTFLEALNQNGIVAGMSCDSGLPVPICRLFLWTPVSSNSPFGTTQEIPIPSGFHTFAVSLFNNNLYPSYPLRSVALNARGVIVGNLLPPAGGYIPFLYVRGHFYDLSQVDDSLAGGIATAINDYAQIVMGSLQGTFLLTPMPFGRRVP
jgi:hypothetical protein